MNPSLQSEAQPGSEQEAGGRRHAHPPSLPCLFISSLGSPHPCPFPPADLLAPEAQLLVTVGNLRGVLDSSVLDPEPGPQGPFITYNYYVTYDFVEDEEAEGSQYGGVLAEVGAWGSSAPGSSEPPVQTGWL